MDVLVKVKYPDGNDTTDNVQYTYYANGARKTMTDQRGCTHLEDAPDCELDAAVADGRLDAGGAARVESLRRLLK